MAGGAAERSRARLGGAVAGVVCRREFVYYGDEIGACSPRRPPLRCGARPGRPREHAGRARRAVEVEAVPPRTLRTFTGQIAGEGISGRYRRAGAIGDRTEGTGCWPVPARTARLLAGRRPCAARMARLCDAVGDAIERGDDILLVSHCIGCVIAYDALWALSRGGYRDGRCAHGKVDHWLTLGSPLGDETVKHRLADGGADARRAIRTTSWRGSTWPRRTTSSVTIIASPTTIDMLDERLLSRLEDVRIYNMAMRYGRSNPHNVLGYLMHPRVSRVIAGWLGDDRLTGSSIRHLAPRFAGWSMIA